MSKIHKIQKCGAWWGTLCNGITLRNSNDVTEHNSKVTCKKCLSKIKSGSICLKK